MWHVHRNHPPRIVSEDDFGPPGQFAVDELRRCWTAVLGAVDGDGPAIRVQHGPADLTDEGYELHTRGDDLILRAGGPLGVVFGAYGLMRIVSRCRFAGLGPGGERLPRRRAVAVDLATPRRFIPDLWYRGLQFYFNDGLELMRLRIDWMAKNGFNYLTFTPRSEDDVDRASLRFDPDTGDEVGPTGKRSSRFSKLWFDQFVLPEVERRGLKLDYNHHNLRSWLPPRRHFAEHPEWYAEIDGKRSNDAKQLSICTTNADAVDRVINNVRAFLRRNPQVKIVGVIPDDGFGMCQCAACTALDDDPADARRVTGRHRDPAAFNASKSRRYGKLLNQVAAALADEFPDVRVGGSAYVDLQWPPRDTPLAENSVVWLAIFWRDGCRPLIDAPPDAPPPAKLNDFFLDLIRQWRRAYRGRLILYEYPMGMDRHRSLPYPMLDVILEEWPHLKRLGVGGVTLQCWGANHESYALNLLAYAAVGWAAQPDRNAMMRDYLLCTFGRAARTLRPLFEALHHAARDLGQSRPGDVPWTQITRCQQQRAARPDEVDYLPPHLNAGILQPTGESGAYLWDYVHRVDPFHLLALARRQVVAPVETANVDALTQVVRYWQCAAEYFQKQTNDIAPILEQIERIPPGWVTPQTVRRWHAAARTVTT